MIYRKTKALCGYNCKQRAKWRAVNKGHNHLACNDHKHRLEGMEDPKDEINERMTEADYQISYQYGV